MKNDNPSPTEESGLRLTIENENLVVKEAMEFVPLSENRLELEINKKRMCFLGFMVEELKVYRKVQTMVSGDAERGLNFRV